MSGALLIYGVTGYSGRLIAESASQRGLNALVAGRNAKQTQCIADSVGLPWRAAGLDEPRLLDAMLADVAVVLHAAGPFTTTAKPMLQACLRTRTHYLDIAGELPVFQQAEHLDTEARRNRIMLMPGAGFVVTASDCLAAHVATRTPQARRLRLATSWPGIMSRGTMRSALHMVRENVSIRRAGELATVPAGHLQRQFDFCNGKRLATAVSAADVVTAWHTTGIPNIEAYAHFAPAEALAYQVGSWFAEPLRLPPVKSIVESLISMAPDGPSAVRRTGTHNVIIAEAEDPWRRSTCARLTTPDGYSCTPEIALGIASRVLSGVFREGFQTPARVFGTDLILEVHGARREDLDEGGGPLGGRAAPLKRSQTTEPHA
jgi:short subunit dehydrogenase-like uncharacterized protein